MKLRCFGRPFLVIWCIWSFSWMCNAVSMRLYGRHQRALFSQLSMVIERNCCVLLLVGLVVVVVGFPSSHPHGRICISMEPASMAFLDFHLKMDVFKPNLCYFGAFSPVFNSISSSFSSPDTFEFDYLIGFPLVLAAVS